MTPDRVSACWQPVAAAGTDPARLANAVARLLEPGGSRLLRRAVDAAGRHRDPAALIDTVVGQPSAGARTAADGVARRWRDREVRAALVSDPAYPSRLAAGWPDSAGPLWLAWRGPSSGLPAQPTVAIVGARRATAYGTGIASWLAAAASDAGALVVSGGAVGIDAAAHAAALEGPGGTAVVLGCGHDIAYPARHAVPGGLFDRILRAGGWLVSELPPTVRPTAHRVRARNRIVAGLADVVVVVEGGRRSGALLTATAAGDRGIPVLAVPGDVRAPGSAAPHLLLAEGAAPCTGPADLLAALRTAHGGPGLPDQHGDGSSGDQNHGPARNGVEPVAGSLPAPLHAVLVERWPRAIMAADLAQRAQLPTARVLAAITRARVSGEVAEGPDGIRLTRAP